MKAEFPAVTALTMRNAGWIIGPTYASCSVRPSVHAIVWPDGYWAVLHAGSPVDQGRSPVLTEAASEARNAAERMR